MPADRIFKGMFLELNYKERDGDSESEIKVPDQTPGAFRLRLVFELVYPNSPTQLMSEVFSDEVLRFGV